MHSAEYYRGQAVRARQIANIAHQPEMQDMLLSAAHDFEEIAEDIERESMTRVSVQKGNQRPVADDRARQSRFHNGEVIAGKGRRLRVHHPNGGFYQSPCVFCAIAEFPHQLRRLPLV